MTNKNKLVDELHQSLNQNIRRGAKSKQWNYIMAIVYNTKSFLAIKNPNKTDKELLKIADTLDIILVICKKGKNKETLINDALDEMIGKNINKTK